MTSLDDAASDQHHAFDFWIGSWDVFGPKGKQVGSNEITAVLGTGAIAEHWYGAGDIEGRSLNAYDAARDRWHQTWIDSTGSVLLLDGGPSDGGMLLEASRRPRTTPAGSTVSGSPGHRARTGLRCVSTGGVFRRRRDLADGLRRPLPSPSEHGLTRG